MPKHDKLYCVVCRTLVDEERIQRGAFTCSKQCATKLRNIRRRIHDLHKCRHCSRPSTPEERRQFRKWREDQGTKRKPGRPAEEKKPDPRQASFTDTICIS